MARAIELERRAEALNRGGGSLQSRLSLEKQLSEVEGRAAVAEERAGRAEEGIMMYAEAARAAEALAAAAEDREAAVCGALRLMSASVASLCEELREVEGDVVRGEEALREAQIQLKIQRSTLDAVVEERDNLSQVGVSQ